MAEFRAIGPSPCIQTQTSLCPLFHIPYWLELLKGAIKLSDSLGLRIIGVDYAIDAESGPLVLEANARPGLSIQIANCRGLVPRFNFIDAHQPESLTVGEKMELTEKMEKIRE